MSKKFTKDDLPLPFPPADIKPSAKFSENDLWQDTSSSWVVDEMSKFIDEIPVEKAVEPGHPHAPPIEFKEPATPDNDIDLIRQSFVIEPARERMKIIVTAVDVQNPSNNNINTVRCPGDPIGCYAYDSQNDCYYIDCVAFLDLAIIPVSYRIKVKGTLNATIVALPDELVHKYLSSTEKIAFKVFAKKFAAPKYELRFMQAITD